VADAKNFSSADVHSYAQAQTGCEIFALVESNREG
jgi:hypothetical protein